MKVKLNILLFVLVLIFGGIVYYIIQLEKQPQRELQRKSIIPFELLDADVKAVNLKNDNWDVFASNIEGRWYLLKPVYDMAKQGVFESIFSMISKLQYRETVTPEDMKNRQLSEELFGLDKPSHVVTVYFKDSNIQIYFGKKTLLGDFIYVKSSLSDNIYTVSANIINVLPTSINALRDSEMFNIDYNLIDSVQLRSTKAGFVELRKEGEHWMFEQPDIGAVDVDSLYKILETTAAIQIREYVWQDFVDYKPSVSEEIEYDANNIVYERYGLKESEIIFGISVIDPIVGDEYSLKISQHSSENTNIYYLARNSLPDIFSVELPPENLKILNFDINDLRYKYLFQTEPDMVESIIISRLDERLKLEKESGVWFISQPVYTAADNKTIESLLNYLIKQVKITSFLNDDESMNLKLEQYMTLELYMTNQASVVSQKIAFYTSENEPTRFFGRFSNKKQLFEVPFEVKLVFGDQVVDPFLFYDKTIMSVASEDVESISSFKKGDDQEKTVSITKEGNWIAGGETNKVNMVAVNTILFTIANLRAECIVDADPETLRKYGLIDPEYIIKIKYASAAGIQKSLLIGYQAGDDGARYAMIKGKDIVFILSPAELNNLTLDLYGK